MTSDHPNRTPLLPENFRRLVAERIGDPVLRRNIRRATDTSMAKRAEVVADYPGWEEMRSAARAIRAEAIAHLPAHLERFEREAAGNGGRVLYAADAEQARSLVLEILRREGARSVVKAKSMVTEEIELRPALESAGIEALETDLGEYIVQLAGEMPSHITAPALHKSREEIGALFAEKLGIPRTSEPEELTAYARRILRDKFLGAGAGISGANFLIAESGAVCLVENEGNIRLSTTLPRHHIVVAGIEKILPDERSLTLFLAMLARSATGQRMTSYTSIIAGPRRAGDADGPEELTVILLDNGRMRMLADPRLREALFCIRCGACMNVCPVYRTIGGHSYGSIYPGPIGSILTPVFEGLKRAKALPFASSLCGACAEVCPVKIDIHHGLLWLRKGTVDRKESSRAERLVMRLWLAGMRSPRLYRLGSRLFRLVAPLLAAGSGSIRMPVWSRTRAFPRPAPKTFRDLWRDAQEEKR